MKKRYLLSIGIFLSCITLGQGKPGASILPDNRGIILLVAALLATVAGIAYGRQRIKIRNRQLLAEKEWLVKELHHRVKNNLQIVMSLLNTQSHYLDNEKAQAAIGQSRNRMYALSLIHQRLYQSDNLERIEMKRYVPDLVQHLRDSFPVQRRVAFHLDIDPHPLDVAVAIPIGLILNEAITNALQYAFPDKHAGSIRIGLWQPHGILLEIADDGIGLGPDFDIRRRHTMGLQLIETLVQQLEGTVLVTGEKGVRISIRIPQPPPA
ncbi:sensor histidine kinase [Puia sp.]|jgi:two-component sensor histidine kinase|uniref:sensor histidine kinase n=1 Tax=Puia sp. TaxID=2045100 RepID=UPI002F427270